jgi:hypothetical protein
MFVESYLNPFKAAAASLGMEAIIGRPASVPMVPARSSDVRCAVSRGGAYPATVFYKLSGQILTLCEADGTVASDAVRGTRHEGETPDAVALELARELRATPARVRA